MKELEKQLNDFLIKTGSDTTIIERIKSEDSIAPFSIY